MPVAQYPDLAPPQVIVTAVYNGANAQAVETAVTTPLEQALNGVEGMLYITSSSTNSGISSITVTFDVTRNSDIAAVDVQNRVSQTLGRLPPEVRALGVNVQKNSTGFVLGAGVYAENGAYDSLFLSNYIDVFVKDALQARARASARCLLFGERRYSMRLWLDPNKLADRGLTAGDVVGALRRAERPGRRRQRRRRAGDRRSDLPDQRARRRPAGGRQAVRRHHREVRNGRLAGAPQRRRPRRAGRRKLRVAAALPGHRRGRLRRASSCRAPTRSRSTAWSGPSCSGCRRRSRPA